MSLPIRVLWWYYLAAAAFTGHCAVASIKAGANWYAAAFSATCLLLLVAVTREYLTADERRAAAVRAERAARLRSWPTRPRAEMDSGCCERWWTSVGEEHDTTGFTRKDRTA
ncbi:MAG: hypothetical protein HOV70_02045 [Streptomyces sp.]|nr:hypothetical protein [Streptomyces sp.]